MVLNYLEHKALTKTELTLKKLQPLHNASKTQREPSLRGLVKTATGDTEGAAGLAGVRRGSDLIGERIVSPNHLSLHWQPLSRSRSSPRIRGYPPACMV